MDVLARASMKDAAKCDTHCELQISVNHQISERIWRCGDFPAARLFQCLLNHTSNTPPRKIKKIVTTCLTFVSKNCCLHVFLNVLRYFLGVDIYDGVSSPKILLKFTCLMPSLLAVCQKCGYHCCCIDGF